MCSQAGQGTRTCANFCWNESLARNSTAEIGTDSASSLVNGFPIYNSCVVIEVH